jgi:hypothetical protein
MKPAAKLTRIAAAGDSLHARGATALLKPSRDIAVLAGLQIIFYLVLTRLEPRFFVIHLYQLIPYVAIVLLIGYGHDRWAYALGSLVSLAWLGLASLAGLLESAVERLGATGSFPPDANLVSLFALATAVVAVLITVLGCFRWMKRYSGRGRTLRTFLISFGIVIAYYGALLRWFWDMMRST